MRLGHAQYRLDPYHLQRRITEALWYDEDLFKKVTTAIYQGNPTETRQLLTEAAHDAKGNRRKDIIKLLGYLEENWNGIVVSPGTKRLGAIEGQIQHNVARRMKRLGAKWTIPGGDHMARLLAAKANGELSRYILRWSVQSQKLKKFAQIDKQKTKVEDVEKWLRTHIPALKPVPRSRFQLSSK